MSPKRRHYGVPEVHVFKGKKPFSLMTFMIKAAKVHTWLVPVAVDVHSTELTAQLGNGRGGRRACVRRLCGR